MAPPNRPFRISAANTRFGEWFYLSMLVSQDWPRKSGPFGKPSVPALLLDSLGKVLGDLGRAIGAERPDIAVRLVTQALPKVTWPDRKFEDLLYAKHTNGWPAMQPVGEIWPWDRVIDERIRSIVLSWFLAELWYGLTRPTEVRFAFDADLTVSRTEGEEAKRDGLDIDPSQLPGSIAEFIAYGVEMLEAYEAAGGVVPQTIPSLVRYVASIRTG